MAESGQPGRQYVNVGWVKITRREAPNGKANGLHVVEDGAQGGANRPLEEGPSALEASIPSPLPISTIA